MVVLLRMGIDYPTIMRMTEGEVAGIIAAFNSLADKKPGKPGKTYKVKR
jgi:hypothetical protein